MTLFALGCLGWRDEQARIRAVRLHDRINTICAVGCVVASIIGLTMGVGP